MWKRSGKPPSKATKGSKLTVQTTTMMMRVRRTMTALLGATLNRTRVMKRVRMRSRKS